MCIERTVAQKTPSLLDEPYLGVKVLALTSPLLGDRGGFLVGLYKYLRLVDDIVDESNMTVLERNRFINAQMDLVADKKTADPEDGAAQIYMDLDWSNIDAEHIKPKILVLLSSIGDDLDHYGYKPRTARELRHYNLRTMIPVFEGLLSIINNRRIGITSEIADLLNTWMELGSLKGLDDDLNQGVLKFPSDLFMLQIDRGGRPYMPDEIFNRLRRSVIDKSGGIKHAFDIPGIPLWQKLGFFIYLTRSIAIKSRLVKNRS